MLNEESRTFLGPLNNYHTLPLRNECRHVSGSVSAQTSRGEAGGRYVLLPPPEVQDARELLDFCSSLSK